jgi:hypothetical protein
MSCSNCHGLELPIGPKGDKGDTGDTGPQGPVGPQGPQGDVGPEGPAGIPGVDGTNGTNGTNGTDGEDGILYQIISIPGLASPGGTVSRFCSVTGAVSVANIFSFVYPGSLTHRTPSRIKVVAYGSDGANQARITISDDTNFADWISSVLITPGTGVAIVDLGVPSNISTTEALIRIQVDGVTPGETITIISFIIDFT